MTATPERIVDIAIGFMGAKQLAAASRIGLFTALADGSKSVNQLATITGRKERQVRILADAMNSLGLLDRNSGVYELSPDAAAYLSGRGEVDLDSFLAFLGGISYRQWLGYDSTVDSDVAGVLDLGEAEWADFLDGVMTYNALHAEQLASAFDFSGYRRALDFGGLAAGFAVAAMQQNAELVTTFVYEHGSAEGIARAAREADVDGRVEIVETDIPTAEPGGSHDLVLLTHVLHRFTETENRAILAAARRAAVEGAQLLVLDFFLDNEGRQRKIDALHAGEYFNIDGTVVYPVGQVEEWLDAAGWEPLRMVELPGSPRVLVARAV